MNLTDIKPADDEQEEQIRTFFRKEIISKMDYNKNKWFPVKPDPNSESYFKLCQNTSMTSKDFEITQYESLEQLRDVLQKFWEETGDYNIVSNVNGFARLAWELRNVSQEKEEVSPYIYVMF